MMTESQRAAMQAALEALKNMRHYDTENLYGLDDEINALRIALEQTEDWSRVEALEASLREHMQEIHRLRDALATQEMRPIAWANVNKQGDITHTSNRQSSWARTPLYTHPPRQQWVGLTDEEINSITSQRWGQAFYAIQRDYARDIEAALRKRNA